MDPACETSIRRMRRGPASATAPSHVPDRGRVVTDTERSVPDDIPTAAVDDSPDAPDQAQPPDTPEYSPGPRGRQGSSDDRLVAASVEPADGSTCSQGEQHLDGAPLVHRAVALGGLLEREGEVEHVAGGD